MTRRLRLDIAELGALRRRIEDPEKVLKQVGAMMAGRAQKTFIDQRLGDERWPERYPGMEEPFINIAAAVEDLKKGKKPKERRFNRRPAIRDTGLLMNSISHEVKGNIVTIGTTVDYAPVHQFGLTTVTQITETARRTLSEEMKRLRKKRQRERKRLGKLQGQVGRQTGEKKKETGIKIFDTLAKFTKTSERIGALEKLGFIFAVDSFETDVAERPFLGFTDEDKADIRELIEESVS